MTQIDLPPAFLTKTIFAFAPRNDWSYVATNVSVTCNAASRAYNPESLLAQEPGQFIPLAREKAPLQVTHAPECRPAETATPADQLAWPRVPGHCYWQQSFRRWAGIHLHLSIEKP